MAYLYYPGCSVEQSSKPYEMSALAVARALGLDLPELDDWNCCGATLYSDTDELLGLALPARNLALAEAAGADDLVTLCNACYVVLNKANKYMASHADLNRQVNDALAAGELRYDGGVRVRHLLDVLVNDVGIEAVSARMQTSLAGLKVAPYYGCQIGRPFDDFDDAEQPTTLDRLLEAVEAEVVPFQLKTYCCGGMLMSTSTDVCTELVHSILECADRAEAQCIATTCPLCTMNLEGYRRQVARQSGKSYRHLPVLAFTQLLAVALGLPRRETGVDLALVSAKPALAPYL